MLKRIITERHRVEYPSLSVTVVRGQA